MAKKLADVLVHASDSHEEEDDDDTDVSVDRIDDNLYLGNLACARDAHAQEKLGISHILTIDVVPLPRAILDRSTLTHYYVKLADIPKEDLITHLPATNEFIKKAIHSGGTILVHCYFGVSRSAAVVIGYIMHKYKLCYEEAFALVKSKRRFIQPNMGFVAQLKLYGHMGCKLDHEDPRFKQFRLKLAGQKLKEVKILPQLFADLVKGDPGLTRERPDPIVYRCKKCRRVVASRRNIIPHVPRPLRLERAKKAQRPPASKLPGINCTDNGQILIEKLKTLACQINQMMKTEEGIRVDIPADAVPSRSDVADEVEICTTTYDDDDDDDAHDPVVEGTSHGRLDGNSELNMVDGSIAPRADAPEVCRLMWFVEPMSWMRDVQHDTQGKLHCPKCQTKIGSFNWVMGCKCPCGQKVAPAFYLVPSKVEWANIVQNVQVTV